MGVPTNLYDVRSSNGLHVYFIFHRLTWPTLSRPSSELHYCAVNEARAAAITSTLTTAPKSREFVGRVTVKIARLMAQAVSVLDGDVNRNWDLEDSRGGRHLLTLFHDTVTGARAAMLDYEVSRHFH